MRLFWIALLALPLFAHDTYLLPERFNVQPGDAVSLSILSGDAFLESESAVEPERLTGARLSTGSAIRGWTVEDPVTKASFTAPKPGSFYAVVSTRPRFIELEGEDFEVYLAEESLDHIRALRKKAGQKQKPGREIYSKHAKTLLVSGAPDKAWAIRMGLPIEIVPETDPSALKPGDELPVRVLLHGTPLKGAVVSSIWVNDASRGSGATAPSDAAGRVKVKIESSGRWKLHTVHMSRHAKRAEADWRSFWASFTFEVPAR